MDNLNQKSRYEFWVTAHTTIGEGAASTKATIQPGVNKTDIRKKVKGRLFVYK